MCCLRGTRRNGSQPRGILCAGSIQHSSQSYVVYVDGYARLCLFIPFIQTRILWCTSNRHKRIPQVGFEKFVDIKIMLLVEGYNPLYGLPGIVQIVPEWVRVEYLLARSNLQLAECLSHTVAGKNDPIYTQQGPPACLFCKLQKWGSKSTLKALC